MLEQQLTSTLLQQRWKQAQLQAAIEQREGNAADMLHTVARLKDLAVNMRGNAGAKKLELEQLEREVMEQAVRMQGDKEQALASARFHTQQLLETRELRGRGVPPRRGRPPRAVWIFVVHRRRVARLRARARC